MQSLILRFWIPVLELHQHPSKDLQREKPKKFDHLVLGPAAGEGLSNRLQCQGVFASLGFITARDLFQM